MGLIPESTENDEKSQIALALIASVTLLAACGKKEKAQRRPRPARTGG
ncbi:MAG: hypothetical protein R3E56_09650 [Burkholderiaceae bacterium]